MFAAFCLNITSNRATATQHIHFWQFEFPQKSIQFIFFQDLGLRSPRCQSNLYCSLISFPQDAGLRSSRSRSFLFQDLGLVFLKSSVLRADAPARAFFFTKMTSSKTQALIFVVKLFWTLSNFEALRPQQSLPLLPKPPPEGPSALMSRACAWSQASRQPPDSQDSQDSPDEMGGGGANQALTSHAPGARMINSLK